jgi:glycine betaine/proline transport system substrate-binding protein
MERRRFLQIMSGVAAGAVAASAGGLDAFAAGRRLSARPRPSARYKAGTGTEKIVLVQNAWTASALDVAIAKKVIEDNLGNPVEITAIDENTMWSGLAGGDLDACLELWPSGISADEQKYLDDGSVAAAGKLGVVGQIGWFVPDYVIEEHPELATWEGYQDPEIGKLFSSPETGDLGRFLGTDPSYSQADETIIKNLGLPFQVVFSGSEPATVAALDSAVAAHEPILMYWWTPTAAAGKYNLVHVELPPYDAANWADPEAIATDYPEDVLVKVVSPKVADKDEAVYDFLTRFQLTNDDQLAMLPSVEIDGEDAADVAAQWVADNEDVWQAWLEPGPAPIDTSTGSAPATGSVPATTTG